MAVQELGECEMTQFTLRVRDTRHTRPRKAATVEPKQLPLFAALEKEKSA